MSFLRTFFQNNGCHIIQSEEKRIEVQLTEELDRAIMNRPFYWHYIKATGYVGEPKRLTLCQDCEYNKTDSEWIDLGTPRMNDISAFLENSSRFIRVFEQLNVTQQTLLYPWLVVNATLTYKGKQMKEDVISIGLNLITGSMMDSAMEKLQEKQLDQLISPHCYTVTPLIKLQSGYQRIEQHIIQYLEQQNYTWVVDSFHLLKEELLLLKHFYENSAQQSELKREVIQLYNRIKPEIKHEVINGGIFYIKDK